MSKEYLNNKAFEKLIAEFQVTKRALAKYEFLVRNLGETIKRKKNSDFEKQMLQDFREKITIAYNNHEEAKKYLTDAFYILARNIVAYSRYKLIDDEEAVQNMVFLSLQKSDRFDENRGSTAFNYFSTVFLNSLRGDFRAAKNYTNLKNKYQDHMVNQLGNHITIKNGRDMIK